MIELIIYIGLSGLLLALVVAFFKVSRRQYESASSSYLIGQDATTAVQWIKRDMQETALSTIHVTREASKHIGMPSMSFVATTEENYPRSFAVSPYGTPDWNRHSFYSLSSDGELNRWDRPFGDLETPKRLLPVPSTDDPSNSEGGVNQKVLLRGVMVPDQQIKIDGKDAPFPKIGEWGGFKPGFVVYDPDGKEHMISQSPSEISELLVTDPSMSVDTLDGESVVVEEIKTTRLIEIQIAIKLKGFRDNSPSAVMIPIRVCPMH
jgi:type II secretory pathway pseudopilin PulG